MRVPVLRSVFFSLAIVATSATPALATSTGGVAAGGSTKEPVPRRRAKAINLLHAAPVVSRSANLAYSGPVFEKTATGEVVPYLPSTPTGQASGPTGGSPVGVAANVKPDLLVPGSRARYVGGLAAAPMSAPAPVQEIVWAGNQIIGLPYIFGGGHASFTAAGYDCSGTVSFALHGASLLTAPEDSSELMAWGSRGIGRWVAVFSNPGHAYMTVAGLRLDTSAADDPSNQQGPRWRPLRQANDGYAVRHPLGL